MKKKYEVHLRVGLVIDAESAEKAALEIEDKLDWYFDECTYCKLLASEEIEEE